jgi:hypothetical protein
MIHQMLTDTTRKIVIGCALSTVVLVLNHF